MKKDYFIIAGNNCINTRNILSIELLENRGIIEITMVTDRVITIRLKKNSGSTIESVYESILNKLEAEDLE